MNVNANLGQSETQMLSAIRVILAQKCSGGKILLTVLRDRKGAIAVFPMGHNGIHNAWIVNSDGSLRCEVEVPAEFAGGLGFYDAYYVSDELNVIYVMPGRDFAFIVDELSGKVIRSHETR